MAAVGAGVAGITADCAKSRLVVMSAALVASKAERDLFTGAFGDR